MWVSEVYPTGTVGYPGLEYGTWDILVRRSADYGSQASSLLHYPATVEGNTISATVRTSGSLPAVTGNFSMFSDGHVAGIGSNGAYSIGAVVVYKGTLTHHDSAQLARYLSEIRTLKGL